VSRRLPQIAFALLAVATIGAFFLVQVLKTLSPLLWAVPIPKPSAINPVHGRLCRSLSGELLNYRHTQITISLSHADTVGIYVVSAANPAGNTVATISSGTPMRASPKQGEYPKTFTWNGRLQDGQPAPQGLYYFRIVLEHQGRSANNNPYSVRVLTQPPHAKIQSVRLLEAAPAGGKTTTTTGTTARGGGTTSNAGSTTTSTEGKGRSKLIAVPGPAVLSPPRGNGVRITFTPGTYRRVTIDIYRTDVAGRPELVDTLPPLKNPTHNWTTWNGKIQGQPAPAGTYLVGITAQDVACNSASWPRFPPLEGSTRSAGVTIRYLSVTPPLTPTVSGSSATVAVNSPGVGFSWRLRRPGSSKLLARGTGTPGRSVIHVPIPRHHPALYTLTVRAGTQSAVVPLVASQAGRTAAHARVLVVLPALTWMGNTPVDDSGDGLPDTLRAGDSVSLARPMVDGLPAGFGQDVALLSYLNAEHLSYQLTTDVALAEGAGPVLADRGGVVFAAGEDFLPAALESILRGFVRGGGRVLAIGTGSFSGSSHISGFPAAPRAQAPLLTGLDPFGARRGPITPTGGQLISELSDPLSLFVGATAFSGFGEYQPIQPPAGTAAGSVSAAGIGSGAPAIVAFHYGGGTVIEVGLPGFASSLAHYSDSQQLLTNAWQLLAQ
jgi:hypothetical protein